jgi:hypothetical protein
MKTACHPIRDLIADSVTGSLAAEQARQLDEHLRDCAACRRYAEALRREDRLLTQLVAGVISDVPARREQLLHALRHRPPQPINQPIRWRIAMKSRIGIVGAAAAVLLATVFGGPSLVGTFFGGSITFAQVIQPILHAQTVVVDTIVGEDETAPAIHDVVKGARIRRTMPNVDSVAIINLDQGRMLTLDPGQKAAAYVDIQGPVVEGTRSYLGLVREIVTRLKDRPDLPVTQLGRRAIDGRDVVGLEVREANTQLTIWADPRTARPLRIEVRQGQSFTILKNIEFDVPVEEALVSMDVPVGYTLHETTLDMREFTEQDFVETLRLWAQLVLDGKFPESLRLEDLMGQMRGIGEKIDHLDVPGEEKMQLGLKLWRGYTFFHVVAHGGAYRYAGAGARLGEAGKAIFWYQPQGSATWRVIYADLSTADVVAEDVPK